MGSHFVTSACPSFPTMRQQLPPLHLHGPWGDGISEANIDLHPHHRPVAASAKRKSGARLGCSKPSIHDAPKAQLLGHHSLIHDFYTRNALSHPHPEVPGISCKKVGAISRNRGIENWPVFFCKFQRRICLPCISQDLHAGEPFFQAINQIFRKSGHISSGFLRCKFGSHQLAVQFQNIKQKSRQPLRIRS